MNFAVDDIFPHGASETFNDIRCNFRGDDGVALDALEGGLGTFSGAPEISNPVFQKVIRLDVAVLYKAVQTTQFFLRIANFALKFYDAAIRIRRSCRSARRSSG